MLRIAVLTLFMSTVVSAQPAKTLPGGAVLKPERPVPVVPLTPPPPALPKSMQPLAPLVGSFSGATKAGAKVSAQCLAVAADTWIRCDVAVDKAAALVAVGWDEASKSFRIFVGDSSGKSTLYKGRIKSNKLVFGAPDRVTLDLGNPQQLIFSSLSEVVTLARER
jgi:hypothetical protein